MDELKGKKEQELVKLCVAKEKALQEFRFGIAGGKSKNVREGRVIRKDIARIKTELQTRALA